MLTITDNSEFDGKFIVDAGDDTITDENGYECFTREFSSREEAETYVQFREDMDQLDKAGQIAYIERMLTEVSK